MGRREDRKRKREAKKKERKQKGFWNEICENIESGKILPIIGNTVYYEHIFDIDGDGIVWHNVDKKNLDGWSIEEQLASSWAQDEVQFPLSEQHWLPRVALYDRVVNHDNDLVAKKNYLIWLKEQLLEMADEDVALSEELLDELNDEYEQLRFSELTRRIGYPRPIQGFSDPLTHLARLNLPIYITTSYFDFLEKAIIANGRKTVRTQICFWRPGYENPTFVKPDHKPDDGFVPSSEQPVVFHLFGSENYPETMVFNEDDYLEFLVAVSRDTNQNWPIVPKYIRQALTQSSLLLLGYRLRDWDFRVMFHSLDIKNRKKGREETNLAIQIDPAEQIDGVLATRVQEYLQGYFGTVDFDVIWDSPHGFVEKLWKEWEKWRN